MSKRPFKQPITPKTSDEDLEKWVEYFKILIEIDNDSKDENTSFKS